MRKNSSSYPVEVVEDAFDEKSPALAGLLAGAARVLLVADMNVVQRQPELGTRIGRYVQAHGITLAGRPVVVAGGEKIKADGQKTALDLAEAVVSARLGPADAVLVLGGGSLFDVAGWAAAQARGGVRVVRVPTTPAAILEAAFATTACLDLGTVKDALSVPCVPAAVAVDVSLARTVLEGVWRGGMGEAARLAVASDAALLKKLEKGAADYVSRQEGTLAPLVKAALASRAKKGGTKVGLWCAHRLESMSGYKLPHGYAVVIALVVETFAAVERGAMAEDEATRVLVFLKSCASLDGIVHSQHLLNQVDNLLCGLDAWLLRSPEGVPSLAGLGATETVAEPDREVYRRAIRRTVALAQAGCDPLAATAPAAKEAAPAADAGDGAAPETEGA